MRYEITRKLSEKKPVEKDCYIQQLCTGKRVLDLGCIRHSAEYALKDPNWLHGKIKQVATSVIGVDYLYDEVLKMRNAGYDIIYGDVTLPLAVDGFFDVIVAGDLIEHLSNFQGFFENCKKLLSREGVLVITTPNPFYHGEFCYVFFKNNFIINPEHTCWIDPLALAQLARRFDFQIQEARYIKPSWKLSNLICENRNYRYDIIHGKWSKNSFFSKFVRVLIGRVFALVFLPLQLIFCMRRLTAHSDYLAVLNLSSLDGD